MKSNSILLKYFLVAIIPFFVSCSHTPYDDLKEIKIGDDKQDVLEKIGSPLRTKRTNNQDIWTYRFFQDKDYIYKEIVIEKQKVIDIQDAREIRMEEVEKKEKIIEQELLKEKKSQQRIFQKKSSVPTRAQDKSSNTDFLDQTSEPADNTKFIPVE